MALEGLAEEHQFKTQEDGGMETPRERFRGARPEGKIRSRSSTTEAGGAGGEKGAKEVGRDT